MKYRNLITWIMTFMLLMVSSFAAYTDFGTSYYSFDEFTYSGNNIEDMTGNFNNGTNDGGTLGVIGKLNESIEFFGGDKVNISKNNSIRSITAWIYPKTQAAGSPMVVAMGNTNEWGLSLGLEYEAPGTANPKYLRAFVNGSGIYYSNTTVNANEWTHIALTLDEAKGDLKIFINGSLVLYNASVVDVPATWWTSIGGDYLGAGDSFTGIVDEVGLYNATLSDAEILEIYNAGNIGNFTIIGDINEFNATIGGDQYTTTNGTIVTNISRNDTTLYDITVEAYGYVTITKEDYSVNQNLVVSFVDLNKLDITIYDEDNGSIITSDINLTLITPTSSIDYEISGGSLTINNTFIYNSSYEFTFESPLYETQIYSIVYDSYFNLNGLDVYLIENGTETIDYTFEITTTTAEPIEDVRIQVYTYVNGSLVLYNQKYTNIIGKSTFSVKENQYYTINISKEGYVTKTFSQLLDEDDSPLAVTLLTTDEIDFTGEEGGVFYNFEPDQFAIDPELMIFNWTVNNTNNDLQYFKIELYNNSVLVSSNSSTSSYGGTIPLYANLSAYENETVHVKYIYKRDNLDEFVLTVPYQVIEYENNYGGLYQLRAYMQNNVPIDQRIGIFILIAIISFIISLEISFLLQANAALGSIPVVLLLPLVIYGVGLPLYVIGVYVGIIVMTIMVRVRGGGSI